MKPSVYINGEKCVAWSYARHGLHDEYPVDTQHPFDLSMYFAATKVLADPPGKVAPAFAGLTVNHEHAARLHRAALTEGYAPGPPLNLRPRGDRFPRVPLRRRIDWWRLAGLALCAASAAITIGGAFLLTWYVLGH